MRCPPAYCAHAWSAYVARLFSMETGAEGAARCNDRLCMEAAVIRARGATTRGVQARFSREARILSRLESSSICQVYDLISGEDADYLIFEYVEGETLRQLLERRRYELEDRIAPLAIEDVERGVLFDEWRGLLVELRVRRRGLQARAARA